MLRIFLIVILFVATKASHSWSGADLGPWGIGSSIVNVKMHEDEQEVKRSRKSKDNKKKRVEDVKSKRSFDEEIEDELDQAEEAIFHAVETVENKVIHAVDDEVEVFFPHHMSKKSEE